MIRKSLVPEMMSKLRGCSLILLPFLLTGPGCSKAAPPETARPVAESSPIGSADGPVRIASDHLPNLVRVHDRVISGGLPEGPAAFEELAALGVKTVISVDGMTPDVQMASRFGLRYVHLPHGYDGIPQQRAKELAKAVRELDGPIYIHCHHGRHRSPAAASVACVSAGLIPSDWAMPVLELAGTNPHYKGLYASARSAEALDTALLDELSVQFREVQQIPPIAEAMVHLEHAQERLSLIARAGWKTPGQHPDLDPVHEALLNRELYSEMLRTEEVTHQPEDFRLWLEDSKSAAEELETELAAWAAAERAAVPTERLNELLGRLSANCKACHIRYRDIPLSEQ